MLTFRFDNRLGKRKSRAGRIVLTGRGKRFETHPKTVIYDALVKITGLSREKLHALSSYEYAPTESVNCFLLWLAWRCQRRVDNQIFGRLHHKWKARFRAVGVPLTIKRACSRDSYYRNLEKRRAEARAKKAKKKATIIGAIEIALRRRLYDLVRHGVSDIRKNASAIELVSCSLDELRRKLEIRFAPGMSWDNYGAWHIDHRKPCVSFNLIDPKEQEACFHWSNLQPLWAVDNLSKGAKIP